MAGFQTISKIRFKTLIDQFQNYYGKQYHTGQIEMVWMVLEKYSEEFVVDFFDTMKSRFQKLPYASDFKTAIRNAQQYETPKEEFHEGCAWLRGDVTPSGLKKYLDKLNVKTVDEAMELLMVKRELALADGKNPDIEIERFHKSLGYTS